MKPILEVEPLNTKEIMAQIIIIGCTLFIAYMTAKEIYSALNGWR